MIADVAGRVPTLWHGRGAVHRAMRRLTAGRETLVIADAAIAAPFLAGLSARTVRVDAPTVDVAAVVTLAREIVMLSPRVVVAVGGGSILDATKLAALALAPGRLFDYAIGHASESALTFLPDAPAPVDVVAVPTTLGTSSETNSVGILKNDRGYRLIVGHALRPRHAVIDPCTLTTLTNARVREGALEAFLRLAGASTSPRRTARGDRDAVVLGRALLETATHDPSSAAGRLRLARLSAATQRTAALRGGDPYSARHWYLANETAFALGARKMAATAAVVGAVWRRICSGDGRWGDRESLEGFWAKAAGGMALPLDPPAGIDALIDRWGVQRPPTPTAQGIDRIAVVTERWWGRRRPMLPGLVADDVRDVLRDSRWNLEPVGGGRRPSTVVAKEVN